MNKNINKNAQIIWNFMDNSSEVKKSDLIWVMCSYNIELAEYAVELYNNGFAKKILFSGAFGKGTSHYFSEPEARVFAARAMELGIPKESIYIDDMATNTGESIIFGYNNISKFKNKVTDIILVQKPYKLRATYNSILKQYPNIQNDNLIPTTPQVFMDIYLESHDEDKTINSMVGELYKVIEYPKSSLMVDQIIPEDVMTAYNYLLSKGYNKDVPKKKPKLILTKKPKPKTVGAKKSIKKK
jgi:uncharacterized SAM-binding protein YcdF (DUF218 family)